MAENSERPLLEVKDLRISFQAKKSFIPTIRGLNFSMKKGEVLGIVGESGSGKSVSSNAIIRLLPDSARIDSGQIFFNGQDLLKLPVSRLRRIRGSHISEIFQDPMTCLDPLFTVGNQLEEVLKKHTELSREERKQKMVSLLDMVGIPQPERRLRQYPHEFSGGMRQRVMIAMALACTPELLIADEPTTALDVTIQAQIIDLLRELKDKFHTSIIFITHDLGVVADICDRVMVMYAGEIVESGDKRQIFYQHRHPYTEGLLRSLPDAGDDGRKPLVPIVGNPPDMSTLGQECAFARRCPYSMNICARKDPPEIKDESGHMVRCWKEYRRLKEEGQIDE